MKRKNKEILVGDDRILEHLATVYERVVEEHPMQTLVEEAIQSQLTDDEKEVYYMRYGMELPIREIASRLGYTSHQTIQVKIARIERKVREYLERDK